MSNARSSLDTYIALANSGIRGLTPYAPGKPISELEREYGITNALKLASNENPLGSSPLALEAIKNNLHDIAIYPDGNCFTLKKQLAHRHNVSEKSVTIGNGSNEILELIARVYLGPKTNCIFSEHAFAVYPIVTQAMGATAKVAPAMPADSDQPYGHDLEAFADLIDDDTRLIMIANPNNPTGTWLSETQLRAFLMSVPEDIVVVVDEAYFEYVGEDEYPDCSLWLSEFPNLVVTRTFSKIYGLAALRIGYGLANEAISDMLNRARQPFNVNALAQVAASAALDDTAFVQQSIQTNAAGLIQLNQGLTQLGLAPIASVGNFVAVNVGTSGEAVFKQLLPKGVIVRPIDNYQLPGFIRITVGNEVQNQRCLQALSEVL